MRELNGFEKIFKRKFVCADCKFFDMFKYLRGPRCWSINCCKKKRETHPTRSVCDLFYISNNKINEIKKLDKNIESTKINLRPTHKLKNGFKIIL